MSIVIEGLDATGKSFLAERISLVTSWRVQKSEGPEKYPGEIIDRCERYRQMPHNTIFDRYPVISQSVYGKIANKTPIPPHYIELLKVKRPLIIYSSSQNRGTHEIKQHDTEEHLDMVFKNRELLEKEYIRFMNEHFNPGYIFYHWAHIDSIVKYAVGYTRGERP